MNILNENANNNIIVNKNIKIKIDENTISNTKKNIII